MIPLLFMGADRRFCVSQDRMGIETARKRFVACHVYSPMLPGLLLIPTLR